MLLTTNAAPLSENRSGGSVDAMLTAKIAELLELTPSEVSGDVSLLELGADSIVLAELVRFIRERLGVHVELRALFEGAQTVNSLVALVGMKSNGVPAISVDVPPRANSPWEILAPRRQNGAHEGSTQPDIANSVHVRSAATLEPNVMRPGITAAPVLTAKTDGNLDDLSRSIVQRYLRRTPQSRNLAKAGKTLVCNNRRSLSEHHPLLVPALYPVFAARSNGAWIKDVDGNDYLDVAMGFGVHLFGHNPSFLTAALLEQVERGVHIGPESPQVTELAGNIAKLTGVERVLFCNTGTEAVMTAIRIARAAGSGDKIVMFRNAYHGHFDQALGVPAGNGSDPTAVKAMAPGMPDSFYEDVILLPYNSDRSIAYIRERAAEIAGVVVEPVQNRRPDLDTARFLRDLRDCTRAAGVLLVFDEVLIGFRLHSGGAQAYFGVDADIVAFGKIIGGGMPIGVVAGRADVMAVVDGGLSYFEPNDPVGIDRIYTAGTFCKNPLTIAAGVAASRELLRHGNALQAELNARTNRFAEKVNARFAALGAPIKVYNTGSFFRFAQNGNLSFVHTPFEMDLFFLEIANNGVYMSEGGTSFLSTAHSDDDIAFLADAAIAAAQRIRSGGGWPEGTRDAGQQNGARVEPASLASAASQTSQEHAAVMIPISNVQRLIWNAHYLDATRAAFNLRTALDVKGTLSRETIQGAIARIVARHEALRARVHGPDSVRIAPLAEIEPVRWIELSHLNAELQASAIEAWFVADTALAMDLIGGDLLFRATVLCCSPDRHIVVLTLHHFVGDGVSQAILADELTVLLKAAVEGREAALVNPVGYAKAMAARLLLLQPSATSSPNAKSAEPSRHPSSGASLALRTYRGGRLRIPLGAEYKARINLAASAMQISHYQLALACFLVAIARYFNTRSVTTGVSVTDRSGAEINGLIANCSHLHSVSGTVDEGGDFKELAASVREQLFAAMSTPAGAPPGARPPTSCFNWDHYSPFPEGQVHISLLPDPPGITRFPFSLNILEIGDALTLEWDFSTDLFSDTDIAALADHFIVAVDAAIPSLSSSRLATTISDRTPTLWAAFRAAVDQHANRRALIDQLGAMTYRDVDAQTEFWATALLDRGVARGDVVAIALPPNRCALIALLAVWRVGAAFVFLDATAPVAWIDKLVQRSGCRILIAEGEIAATVTVAANLDFGAPLPAVRTTLPPPREPASDDLAYLVFTSGTTGSAKAVPIRHGQLADYAIAMADRMQWKSTSFLQLSPFFVDLGYTMWTAALMTGGTLLLPGTMAARDPNALASFTAMHRPDYAKATPSHVAALIQMPGADMILPGTALILGGEQLNVGLAAAIRGLRPDLTIVNHYGPAEACIGACTFVIRPDDPLPAASVIPIGAALGDMHPVLELALAERERAELILVGPRVATGYWRENEKDPRFEGAIDGLGRFRTGDLVTWTEIGDLIFAGRLHDVAKWQGLRINPADIAAAATGIAQVLQARVTVSDEALRLTALVGVGTNSADIERRLATHLADILPPYMRPTVINVVNEVHLASSGKGPATSADPSERRTSPKSENTEVLRLFRRVLDHPTMGSDDSLFEASTDSIKYINLLAALKKELGVTINLETLFDNPTPAQLSAVLSFSGTNHINS